MKRLPMRTFWMLLVFCALFVATTATVEEAVAKSEKNPDKGQAKPESPERGITVFQHPDWVPGMDMERWFYKVDLSDVVIPARNPSRTAPQLHLSRMFHEDDSKMFDTAQAVGTLEIFDRWEILDHIEVSFAQEKWGDNEQAVFELDMNRETTPGRPYFGFYIDDPKQAVEVKAFVEHLMAIEAATTTLEVAVVEVDRGKQESRPRHLDGLWKLVQDERVHLFSEQQVPLMCESTISSTQCKPIITRFEAESDLKNASIIPKTTTHRLGSELLVFPALDAKGSLNLRGSFIQRSCSDETQVMKAGYRFAQVDIRQAATEFVVSLKQGETTSFVLDHPGETGRQLICLVRAKRVPKLVMRPSPNSFVIRSTLLPLAERLTTASHDLAQLSQLDPLENSKLHERSMVDYSGERTVQSWAPLNQRTTVPLTFLHWSPSQVAENEDRVWDFIDLETAVALAQVREELEASLYAQLKIFECEAVVTRVGKITPGGEIQREILFERRTSIAADRQALFHNQRGQNAVDGVELRTVPRPFYVPTFCEAIAGQVLSVEVSRSGNVSAVLDYRSFQIGQQKISQRVQCDDEERELSIEIDQVSTQRLPLDLTGTLDHQGAFSGSVNASLNDGRWIELQITIRSK